MRLPVEREFLALPFNFAGQRTILCGSSSRSRWTLNVPPRWTDARSDRTRLNNLVAVSNLIRPVGSGDPIFSTPERACTGRGSIVCWWHSNCPLCEVSSPLSPPRMIGALGCYPRCFEIVGHVNSPIGAWLFRMPIGRGNNCHPIRFLAVG